MERVDTFKEGKVYLVYDAEHHRMAVEKHLQGNFRIYEQLQALSHSYLPQLYAVPIRRTKRSYGRNISQENRWSEFRQRKSR